MVSGSAEKAYARDFFNDPLGDMSNAILCDYTLEQHVPCSAQNVWLKGGGLNARRFNSRREIQARGPSILTLLKFGVFYRLLKGAGVIFGRREITSDQLAAHDSVGRPELVADNAEAPNNREFHPQQGIHARGPPEVRTEAVARDGTAGYAVAALLKSRESEIIPEDQDLRGSASLASRAFDDLD